MDWCGFAEGLFPEMAPTKSVTRSGRTSTFTWYGDVNPMRAPLAQWTDMESSNGSSGDEYSDATDNGDRIRWRGRLEKGNEDSEMSDIGECDDRRRFRNNIVKVQYDSDSCLTPRSRRTLRRTLSGNTEPWPSVKTPSKPTLDTIFSPTHEILHPLQSLRRERSVTIRTVQSEETTARSTNDGLMSVKARPNPDKCRSFPSSKPRSECTNSFHYTSSTLRSNPTNFRSPVCFSPKRNSDEVDNLDSLTPVVNFSGFKRFESTRPRSTVATTMEEEKLEQKQSLIDFSDNEVDSSPPKTFYENIKSTTGVATALAPNIVAIVVNAEKKLTFVALDWAINVAVRPGDEVIVLGVLKHISSPMGFKMLANTDPLIGVNKEILQASVSKVEEIFEQKLVDSGRREECEKKQVKLTVRIAPGTRTRVVVVRELSNIKATYAIFDRRAMRSRRYYSKHLSCHAVRMRKNGRSTKTITLVPHKGFLKPRSPISCISSSSVSSRSTNRASSDSPTATFWRRLTTFRSSRHSWGGYPRGSSVSRGSDALSPSDTTELHQQFDDLSSALKSFSLGEVTPKSWITADAHSHPTNRSAISVTMPPSICAT